MKKEKTIHCNDLDKEINKSECYHDVKSPACESCPEKPPQKIRTPHQFADYYLSEEVNIPYFLKDFDNHIKGVISIDNLSSDDKEGLEALLNKFVGLMKYRLGPILFHNIKQHYDNDTMRKLCIALSDIHFLLEFEKEGQDQQAEIERKRKKLHKSVKKWIKNTEEIINIEGLLHNDEKSSIEGIKNRLNKCIKPNFPDFMDSLFNDFIPKKVDVENDQKLSEYLTLTLLQNFKRKRSRPYAPLNAYIVIINRILTNPPPNNKRQYKEWCKQHTAGIFNVIFGYELTPKDIDNAIHTI